MKNEIDKILRNNTQKSRGKWNLTKICQGIHIIKSPHILRDKMNW